MQQLAWDRGGIIAEGESIGALDKRMILRRQNGEVEELFFRNLIHYRIEKIARKFFLLVWGKYLFNSEGKVIPVGEVSRFPGRLKRRPLSRVTRRTTQVAGCKQSPTRRTGE